AIVLNRRPCRISVRFASSGLLGLIVATSYVGSTSEAILGTPSGIVHTVSPLARIRLNDWAERSWVHVPESEFPLLSSFPVYVAPEAGMDSVTFPPNAVPVSGAYPTPLSIRYSAP